MLYLHFMIIVQILLLSQFQLSKKTPWKQGDPTFITLRYYVMLRQAYTGYLKL